MRLAAAPVTPAFQAPTIVRIRPNAITAVAIPTMVSAVRRRCRNRFLNTSRRSFTAGPSLQFALVQVAYEVRALGGVQVVRHHQDRKSTRLNSSHLVISYAVFCLKKKNHHGPPCLSAH